jgi:hypothetical protein
VQSRLAAHPCRFAFECNTHERPKMLQIFAAPESHSIKRTNIKTQKTQLVKRKSDDR